MKVILGVLFAFVCLPLGSVQADEQSAADASRVLPNDQRPNDSRLGDLRDLNAYFPMAPPASPDQWAHRAEELRRRVLLSQGIWPLPNRSPVEATVHGRVERDGYSVDRVFFESSPGLYVTGSLYRPDVPQGTKMPVVLCPHGHWADGRFYRHSDSVMKRELESGAEQFEIGGRTPIHARCVQLARMGCLVFHYDMLGYADSVPLTYDLAHRFAKQREHLNRPQRWGLFSAQSELRLVNSMGLQTWNSLRIVDWILSLPEADATRIGVTGASGGGTQTFVIASIDDRITAAMPAVMVSTAMQGGCTCENASYLRIGTGNIELAALVAPRPLGLTGANDWTQEIETKGLPELRELYAMLGVPDRVEGRHFSFPHNYNAVSRQLMYEFFNKHFELGFDSPIQEQDYDPLSKDELTVWTDEYPKPASDEDAEIAAIKSFYELAVEPVEKALAPKTPAEREHFLKVIGGAWRTMIGRDLPRRDFVETKTIRQTDTADSTTRFQVARYLPGNEEVPFVLITPNDWNHETVILTHGQGKSTWFKQGKLQADVQEFLADGYAVAMPDLLYQGEFLDADQEWNETRTVKNPREFAGYTAGYNHPLFAKRVHDVLTVTQALPETTENVHLVGVAGTGAITAAAKFIAGPAIASLAVDTEGFRFEEITSVRDVNFLPGAIKYGDVPALLTLASQQPLWLTGEGSELPTATVAWNPKNLRLGSSKADGMFKSIRGWLKQSRAE
ncbi:alpha/beta hydrolase family protein [Thalassoroseus pseudoceratinae]|uniref:alpha/beta hydrolase family protein n=1 Tax=Thalassoroseus pseudoceratinae TaxID=2713176 RepID=UPI00141F86AE|nr:acetylxylan esterase [Thalassoroseus pseudoceratinae]